MSRTLQLRRRAQAGATLIEILVSLVILMLGLLGLVGVMIQSQRAQLESYQRMQALLLVQDMATRITTNRAAAQCYEQAGALGTGYTATPDATACATGTIDQKTRVSRDLAAWDGLLKGSAEQVSGGTKVGSILGARGCITRDATTGIFQVAVAWQATEAGGAPPAGITCGTGQYGDDAHRRAVSITVLPAST